MPSSNNGSPDSTPYDSGSQPTGGGSSILTKILEWAETQPDWQRDALRRLVQKPQLDVTEIDELTKMCAAACGLVLSDPPAPQPVPVCADHLPASATLEPVSLISIDKPTNVNALASDQVLKLGQGPPNSGSGLAVVYGENASGKSGFVRILKQVCRARAREGQILPNIYSDPGDTAGSASALIRYQEGNREYHSEWTSDAPADKKLSTISVLDSSCAAVQVKGPNDIAYTPFGLDLLENLVSVCRLVQQRLKDEKEQLDQTKNHSLYNASLSPGTTAHSLLTNLAHDSDIGAFRRAAEFDQPDAERLEQLDLALRRDPMRAAESERITLKQVELLSTHLKKVSKLLSDSAEENLKSKLSSLRTAESAAKLAADQAFPSEVLPGTGGESWKLLWESARQFSKSDAYSGFPFPFVAEEAVCLLCQQPLAGETPSLLQRFERFVREDVQQTVELRRAELHDLVEAVSQLAIWPRDVQLAARALKLVNGGLTSRLRRFLASARLRKMQLTAAISSDDWSAITALLADPGAELEATQGALRTRISDFLLAADSDERRLLEEEASELRDKKALAEKLDKIETEIERLRKSTAVDASLGSTDTSGITRFSSVLTDDVLTARLDQHFKSEVRKLRVGAVQVELVDAGGRYGAKRFQIRITDQADVQPDRILSEGEHKCIALAGFLAELGVAPHKSAIVLDDPVSSLDHKWLRHVARRLVEEAASRQVVIFTHDAVFLYDLLAEAENSGVPVVASHLQRGGRALGRTSDGVPWVAMKLSSRIGHLNERLQQTQMLWNRAEMGPYEQSARDLYGLLREACERAVEEVLLDGTVIRFSREVHIRQLRKLTDIEEEDIRRIDSLVSKCSGFMRGHDDSIAVAISMPDPEEIQSDINNLKSWAKAIRQRRQ